MPRLSNSSARALPVADLPLPDSPAIVIVYLVLFRLMASTILETISPAERLWHSWTTTISPLIAISRVL
jgi:hypothetical protein